MLANNKCVIEMDNQTENINNENRKLDSKTLPWLVLGVIIIGIAGFTLWSTFNTNSESTSNVASVSVPDFSLTNQQSQPLGLTDLTGKVWVADFIFTHCPTICPIMTKEMAKLQSEFEIEPVYFVSFTVDPERDTTEVLSKYAERYGADEKRWHFLTGDKEKIYKLANDGFRLSAAQHGNGFPHSTKFALVEPNGKVHDYYDSRSKPMMKKLRLDIEKLLKK